jgi:hypothetical protein
MTGRWTLTKSSAKGVVNACTITLELFIDVGWKKAMAKKDEDTCFNTEKGEVCYYDKHLNVGEICSFMCMFCLYEVFEKVYDLGVGDGL